MPAPAVELAWPLKPLPAPLTGHSMAAFNNRLYVFGDRASNAGAVNSYEYDIASDTFTFNDNFYRIFRTTAEKVGGYQMPAAEYVRRFCHPDDAPMVAAETRLAIESTDPNFSRQVEHRILFADGTVGHIAVRFSIVKDAQGRTVKTYGVNQDITAYREAEEALRASQQLAESIIDSIPGTFYMLDEAGKYVRWSAYQRDEIVGKPDDQIAGFPAIDTIHPDDRALVQARIENVLRTGVVETVEARVLLRGGPKFQWLLMTGRRLLTAGHPYLVGIGIDITARKQADAKLNEQLDELRRWQVVTLGRENRVQELKREVNDVCRRLGEPAR